MNRKSAAWETQRREVGRALNHVLDDAVEPPKQPQPTQKPATLGEALAQMSKGSRPAVLWVVDTHVAIDDDVLALVPHFKVEYVNSDRLPQAAKEKRAWWRRTPGVWVEFADGRVWNLLLS